MGASMSMDADQLKKALEILQNIPHDLHGDRGHTPIEDLRTTHSLPDDLRGFAVNSGSAASWIANCCTDLQGYIGQLVTQLESACSAIGGQMDNSITAYTGSDSDSSGGVR